MGPSWGCWRSEPFESQLSWGSSFHARCVLATPCRHHALVAGCSLSKAVEKEDQNFGSGYPLGINTGNGQSCIDNFHTKTSIILYRKVPLRLFHNQRAAIEIPMPKCHSSRPEMESETREFEGRSCLFVVQDGSSVYMETEC